MILASACGPYLDACSCSRRAANIPRSPAEVAARHQAAVARAIRSGWPARRVIPRRP